MYVGICKEIGKTVSDEEAFDYAFDRCMKGTSFGRGSVRLCI